MASSGLCVLVAPAVPLLLLLLLLLCLLPSGQWQAGGNGGEVCQHVGLGTESWGEEGGQWWAETTVMRKS